MCFGWLLLEEPCCLVSSPRCAGWALGPAPPSCRAGDGRGSAGCADVPAARCSWQASLLVIHASGRSPAQGCENFLQTGVAGPLVKPCFHRAHVALAVLRLHWCLFFFFWHISKGIKSPIMHNDNLQKIALSCHGLCT